MRNLIEEQIVDKELNFEAGELYVFYTIDDGHSDQSCLWGMYDHSIDDVIFLESSSKDLLTFHLWHRLPLQYCYCRRATRAELRDYIYNLAIWELSEIDDG